MFEEWRPVRGYKGLYEVSSQGRVRRIDGAGGRRDPDGLLRPRPTGKGYWRVALHDGFALDAHIHVLVAEAFIGPRPDGMQCNHRDGVKTNNAVSNLEWVTPAANMQHAVVHGLRPDTKGAANGRARLNQEQVLAIRRRGSSARREMAAEFGVSVVTIDHVIAGRTWQSTDEEIVRTMLLGPNNGRE